jgi:hypothetical protein
MEGNNSSAYLMISKYQYIITFIKKNLAISSSVLIATILNPSFRLSIFKVLFPSHYNHACDLIHKLFETRNAQVNIALSSFPDKSDALIGTKRKATNLDQEDIDSDGPLRAHVVLA